MADGSIIIDTQIDSSGAETGVNNLGGRLSNVAKTGLKVFTGAVIATGAALSTLGAASINLASDLQEVQNVVDVTFGDNASEINEWAKNAATAFGLSELQAKQFNGTMGSMLKSMGLTGDEVLDMSESMTGLAGDFASFYNLDPTETFAKIRAGISGETEPLKQLGINMSVANLEAYALAEGLTKPYNEMTQAEQAMLRYNYLMDVSADAQGDFERTSDSLANQLKIAKLGVKDLGSTIGTALLPMAQEAVSELNGMVGQLKDAFEKGGFDDLVAKFGDVFSQIIVKIAEKAPDIINAGISAIQSFISGIQSNLPQIANSAIQIVTSLFNGILALLPQILELGIELIINLAQGIAQAIPGMIPTLISVITGMCDTIISNIGTIVDVGIQILMALVQGLVESLPTLIQEVPRIINDFSNAIYAQLPKILKAGIDILLMLIKGLIDSIPTLIANLPQIILAIINVITLYNWASLGKSVIKSIGKGITSMKGHVLTIGKNIAQGIGNAIKAIFTGGLSWGKNLILNMDRGFSSMGSFLRSSASSIARGALNSIKSIFTGGFNIGKNLIRGIWNGIGNMKNWILNKIGGFAGNVISGIKDFFGIHSPSRIMRDLIGVNLVKGIGVGVDVETPKLQKDIDANMSDLTTKMKATVDYETSNTAAKVVGGNSNKNYSNTINNNDNGVTQNVTIVNPERTPSENARALKKVGRDLAFE
ncbi:phage tail protein [Clostridium sp. DL1XJH146]